MYYLVKGHSLNKERDYEGTVESQSEALARLALRRTVTAKVMEEFWWLPSGVPYLLDTRYVKVTEISKQEFEDYDE